jgi:UDP-2,3-diacylglucosamine hydrolase
MHTLFISDLHLSAARPKTSALFLKFLKEKAQNADALYILGDFFEAWIGDDIADHHDAEILNAISQFSQTTPIYFMPGNRDFLINKQFAHTFGSTYLSDPTVIQLYDQPVLLMHGDSLCTLDKKYQRYRRFVQYPLVQKAFLTLPGFIRRWIANSLRKKAFSKEKRDFKSPNTDAKPIKSSKAISHPYWDVVQESVEKALQTHQTQILIHGHTHKPGVHDFIINNQAAKRVVLGEWEETGSVLVYTPQIVELQTVC